LPMAMRCCDALRPPSAIGEHVASRCRRGRHVGRSA
jgi:hypothetical protein